MSNSQETGARLKQSKTLESKCSSPFHTISSQVIFRLLEFHLTADSIWKPLRGPLRSWPLALCDLRSLSREDVITFDEVHATAVLESQQVVYNPSQKWYYLPNQESNEIIVFKSMDTVVRGEGLNHLHFATLSQYLTVLMQLLMGPSTTQTVPTMNPRERALN